MGRSGVNLSAHLLEITFNSDPRGLCVAKGVVIKPPDSEPFGVGGLSFSYIYIQCIFEEQRVGVRKAYETWKRMETR